MFKHLIPAISLGCLLTASAFAQAQSSPVGYIVPSGRLLSVKHQMTLVVTAKSDAPWSGTLVNQSGGGAGFSVGVAPAQGQGQGQGGRGGQGGFGGNRPQGGPQGGQRPQGGFGGQQGGQRPQGGFGGPQGGFGGPQGGFGGMGGPQGGANTAPQSNLINFNISGLMNRPSNGTSQLTPGTSHTVAFVASSQANRREIYVDGKLHEQVRGGNVINNYSWRQLCIGCDANGGNPFNGTIEKVALWNRVLSAEELAKPDLSTADFAWSVPEKKVIAGNLPLFEIRRYSVDGSQTVAPEEALSVWCNRVPQQWTDMLPLGNGYMGAMVSGKIEHETILLNEDTLWGGGPYDHLNPNASAEKLAQLRQAIFNNQGNANDIAQRNFLSRPSAEMPFSQMGALFLEQDTGNGNVTNYRHALNLRNSVAQTTFVRDGVTYTREYFASYPDHIVAVKLSADKPGKINVTVGLGTAQDDVVVKGKGNELTLTGHAVEWHGIAGATNFQISSKVFNQGGKLLDAPKNAKGDTGVVQVANADSVVVILTAATSYVNYKDVSADPAARTAAVMKQFQGSTVNYDAVKQKHIADYQSLFNRVTLDFKVPHSNKPTDERLNERRRGNTPLDPDLATLYFQYGRYLLISSSRPGSQPANLQGVWSEELSVPWESKYTININAQMNYWPAESANLSECHQPLLDMITEMVPNGREAASRLYQVKNGGWVAHHNTDLWRQCGPIDLVPTGMWPMGAAWLCLHFWEHYQYTRNLDELKVNYPVMRDAAKFFLEFLVPDPKHNNVLVTIPSYSPEQGPLCASPTMDTGILMALFKAVIASSELLNTDADLRATFTETMKKFPPFKVGSWGQLMEWQDELREDNPNNQHRHISHLFAVYPGNVINYSDKTLFDAARMSLTRRGDDATGWSMGWKINLWARMRDGDHTWKLISNLIHPSRTYNNLFDAHPPFQIDGNFGGTAGIIEMLMQSHEVTADGKVAIDVLPALPSALPNGVISGIRTRGAAELTIEWANGKLTKVTASKLSGIPMVVRYGDKVADISGKKGSVTLTAADFR